ncbi:hypothetical protein QYF36_001205 [Acer negundo]|nr:hypothetical protein QYF36_001205 [Acer negundo]
MCVRGCFCWIHGLCLWILWLHCFLDSYSNVSCNAIVEIEARRIKIRKLESGNEIGMFLQQCLKISWVEWWNCKKVS